MEVLPQIGSLSVSVAVNSPVMFGAYLWCGHLKERWRLELNLAVFGIHLQVAFARPQP